MGLKRICWTKSNASSGARRIIGCKCNEHVYVINPPRKEQGINWGGYFFFFISQTNMYMNM